MDSGELGGFWNRGAPRRETAGRDSELCPTKYHRVHARFQGTAGGGGQLNPLGHCCPRAIPGSRHDYSHQIPSPQVREGAPRRQLWSRSGFRGTLTAGYPVVGKATLTQKVGYVVGGRRRASCKALSSAPGDALSAQPCSAPLVAMHLDMC